MTIETLIEKIQAEKPNAFSDDKLLEFVNEIESDVAEQVNVECPVYTLEDDLTRELLVPAPYDRLYVSYLKAMVDYTNEEYASYQLNQEQHAQDFSDFLDWAVRTRQISEPRSPRRFRNIFC